MKENIFQTKTSREINSRKQNQAIVLENSRVLSASHDMWTLIERNSRRWRYKIKHVPHY